MIGVAAAFLVAQYLWYRARAEVWAGPEDGPRLIRVGLESDHPPFSSLGKDGRLAGFEPDIARALCERMRVRCALVAQPWDRMFLDLMDGKYDIAVSSTPVSDVLASNVDFSDRLYSLSALLLCCGSDPAAARTGGAPRQLTWRFAGRRDAAIDFTPRGTAGLRVGTVRWGNYGEMLGSIWPDARFIPYDTLAAAIGALEAGRIDLLLGDEATLRKALLDTDEGKGFAFLGPALEGPGMLGTEAGIAVRKENADLLPPINAALKAIRADGTYGRIERRYFGFDIDGG